MQFLVVLSSLVACTMAQVLFYSSYPYGLAHHYAAPLVATPFIGSLASQFRAQDELGQFTFATTGDNQARAEVATLDGAVRGAYSYVDATGKLINVHYLADDQGFRVIGANNLPEAPAVPEPPVLHGPEPVKDTPEVMAARAAFQKQYVEAARAAAASPETPVSRKKRSILYSAPAFTLAAPAVAKTTIKYQQYEPVEAAVPADTQKIELKEREKEVVVPAPDPAPISFGVPHALPAPHLYSVVATSQILPGPQYVSTAPQVYSVAATPQILPAPQVLPAPQYVSVAPQVYSISASPQIIAAPTLAKTTIKYQQYEPVDAPTPADTKKIELKEREQEIITPTYSLPLPFLHHSHHGLVVV